ncbi:hypothetical protein GCM10027072_04620 [Streptomyces bullii]
MPYAIAPYARPGGLSACGGDGDAAAVRSAGRLQYGPCCSLSRCRRTFDMSGVVGRRLGRRPVQSAVQRGPLVEGVAEERVVGEVLHGGRSGPPLGAPVPHVQRVGGGRGRAEELGELGDDGLVESGSDSARVREPEERGGRPPGPDMSCSSWSGPVLLDAAPASPDSRQKAEG